MPQPRATCPYCGIETAKGNLYNHTHKSCPKRPDAAPTVAVHVKAPVRRATGKALQELGKAAITTVRDQHGANGRDCDGCPFRGNHAEQDLFRNLVRGGMTLADARAALQQAKAVFRTR